MLTQIYTYFTIETIYLWLNFGVIPIWLVLIFFPNSKLNKIFLTSIFLPLIFGLIYVYIFYQLMLLNEDILDYLRIYSGLDELADLLTMLGFESEVVTDFSVLQNIVVGEVESAKKHPNADKLKFCIVNDGKTTHEVVCGAPNVATGQKIVFAKVGAVLPGNFKIGKGKIRGIESNGMICSEEELRISEEHDGIMVLDSGIESGTNVADILGPMYDAIDIDITPDKAFALSHRGIARELAAKLNKKLKE